MPRYRISVHRKVDKFIERLDEKRRRKVLEDFLCLENFPQFERRLDILKMRGHKNLFRLRSDDFRTEFSVDKAAGIIYVLKISRRESAYE